MSKNLLRFTIGLMVFQLIFWTFVPLMAHHAPPLDATEMYGWSLSFQWGFYKHPPMPAWVVAIVQTMVGKSMFSLFLCASIVISASYYAVAWLANRFLEEKEATVALFLYALTLYCHLWSTDFNHNQMQMPFWAFSFVCLVHTLDTGSRKWAILLGIVMGLNALSKYTAALIVPCAVLLLIISPYWRRNLNITLISIASIAFLTVFSPHLYWLTMHDFMPFHYVNERFDEMRDTNRLFDIADYIGNILLAHLFLLMACLFLLRKKVIALEINNQEYLYVWVMGIGPIALTIIIGLFAPLYHRWAIPMLPMVTIVMAILMKGRFIYLYNKKALFFFLILQLLFGMIYIYKDQINPSQSARGQYPAPELAHAVYEQWHRLYPNKPMKIVAGGEWEAGFVSLFSPDKTYVFTQANSVIAPWVTEKDVHNCGMVILNPTQLQLEQFSNAKVQESIQVKNEKNNSNTQLEFAISPPQGECQLK